MTQRKPREPDDSAERECETEGIKITTGYRIGFVWPSGRDLASTTYETRDEAELKSEAWLVKGYRAYEEEAYCWTIMLTGQGSPIRMLGRRSRWQLAPRDVSVRQDCAPRARG
jgi:hypothetical protein